MKIRKCAQKMALLCRIVGWNEIRSLRLRLAPAFTRCFSFWLFFFLQANVLKHTQKREWHTHADIRIIDAKQMGKGSILIFIHWMLDAWNCKLWQGCEVFDAHFEAKKGAQRQTQKVYVSTYDRNRAITVCRCFLWLCVVAEQKRAVPLGEGKSKRATKQGNGRERSWGAEGWIWRAIFKQRKLTNNNT